MNYRKNNSPTFLIWFLFIVLFLGSMAIYGLVQKNELWLVILTFGLVVGTFALAYVAWEQLTHFNDTSSSDLLFEKSKFVYKLKKDFFNENTRDIIMLINYDALKFRNANIEYGEDIPSEEFPYFLIDQKIVSQLKIDEKKKKFFREKEQYSSFEIDDYLLGSFEEIGSFEKQKVISLIEVYNQFDWYIDITWNNDEIQKYIAHQQDGEKDGGDIYENFKYIYEKLKKIYKNGK